MCAAAIALLQPGYRSIKTVSNRVGGGVSVLAYTIGNGYTEAVLTVSIACH